MSDLKPNSLAVKAPHLRGEWSTENAVNFEDATCGEHTKYKWVCPAFGHPYEAAASSRAGSKPSGCPRCPKKPKRVTYANSLSTKAPHLAAEWSPRNEKKFHEVHGCSNELYWWDCIKCRHQWEAPPQRRTAKRPRGCPRCAGKVVSETNSLATRALWLEKEWSPNNKKKFHEVSYASSIEYEWVCDSKHFWDAPPRNRTGAIKSGCPECCGKRVSIANSLATKAPWLEKEWSPNNTKKFHEVSYGSDMMCLWICIDGFEWPATPSNRTAKAATGCPHCTKRHSKAEIALFQAIKSIHPDAVSSQRGLLRPGQMELDIYVPSLQKAIEYDGMYWHSRPGCKERDFRKDQQCAQVGIKLLRVSDKDYEADRAGTIAKALEWLAAP